MTISAPLLAANCAELARRLGIDPALITTRQESGTEIRVPASVDGPTLSQTFIQVFPHVGMFDRRADGSHHLLRIYDLHPASSI